MHLPPAQLPGDGDYIRFQNTVTNLNVVNDATERAVKDVTDFSDYSPYHARRDDVVRVMNSHREA